MQTLFSEINESFLSSITDGDLAEMAKEEMEEDLLKYMKKFISLDFKVCKKKLLKYLNLPLKQFDVKLTEEEINIIGMGMVSYWLQPKILHQENLKQRLGDRDYKGYSEGNLLDKMTKLNKEIKIEINSYVRAYSYNEFAYEDGENM